MIIQATTLYAAATRNTLRRLSSVKNEVTIAIITYKPHGCSIDKAGNHTEPQIISAWRRFPIYSPSSISMSLTSSSDSDRANLYVATILSVSCFV